ncbi:MAG: FMN-binding protein [Bacillota bacterium]
MAKLKTALVLLIIGSFSGLAIVGVQNLTEDRIEENRVRAQNENYVEIFPELADVEEEDIEDDDVLDKKFTILDSDGNELGVIYRGTTSNDHGDVTTLVGIEGETIKEVVISDHSNTPNYANIIIEDYLDPFSGQEVSDVSYDSDTGATQTYNSVQEVVDAATVMAQGGEEEDPEKDAYASLLEDTDDYEGYLEYDGFEFKDENSILDSDGDVIAYGFLMEIEDEDVRLLFAPDTTFVGAVSLAEEPSDEVSDLLSDLNEFSDEPIKDIDASEVPGTFETAFEELDPFLRDYERMNDGRVKEEELMNDSDELEGFDYTLFYAGYSGTANELSVEVNTDGEVVETELLNHYDTGEYVDDNVTPNLDHYDGDTLDDLEDAEGSDAFSGASGTGGSVVDAITSALELHDRRSKYAEIFDQASSVEREYVQGYDTLVRQITVFDDSGDELGVIYEGEQVNSVGPLTIYVGIEGDTLKAVTLPYHENTGEYVDPLMEDYVEPLAGTELNDVSYDSDTGATVTYNSIQDAIDEAIEAENERTGD